MRFQIGLPAGLSKVVIQRKQADAFIRFQGYPRLSKAIQAIQGRPSFDSRLSKLMLLFVFIEPENTKP